jgi:hypothetical protein
LCFHEISAKKLALLFMVGGVVFVSALFGSSLNTLFQSSITEVKVKIKQVVLG